MITLHHLAFSRSTRVLWLLEEIGIPYAIVHHARLPGFRAPDELASIHPAGKAPVLIDGALTIAESGVILAYIDSAYADCRYTPADEASILRHDEWLWFAETGIASPLMVALYARLTEPLAGVFGSIIAREAHTALERLERSIVGPYLFGSSLTLADVQLSYVLELANHLGHLPQYPGAAAYLEALRSRPALQRALVIGGPMVPAASRHG